MNRRFHQFQICPDCPDLIVAESVSPGEMLGADTRLKVSDGSELRDFVKQRITFAKFM